MLHISTSGGIGGWGTFVTIDLKHQTVDVVNDSSRQHHKWTRALIANETQTIQQWIKHVQ